MTKTGYVPRLNTVRERDRENARRIMLSLNNNH